MPSLSSQDHFQCLFIEGVWKTVLKARHPKRKELTGNWRQDSGAVSDATPRLLGGWDRRGVPRTLQDLGL